MSTADTTLQTDTIRTALQSFWSEALQVESIKDGFAIAMPVSLPDGWQMVVDLTDQTPAGVRLTDRGRTLSWLTAQGQNIDTANLTEQIAIICRQSQIKQNGWELFGGCHSRSRVSTSTSSPRVCQTSPTYTTCGR